MFWKMLCLMLLVTSGLQAGETGHTTLTEQQFNLVRERADEPLWVLDRMLTAKQRLDKPESVPVPVPSSGLESPLDFDRALENFYLVLNELDSKDEAHETAVASSQAAETYGNYLLYFHAGWCPHCVREEPHFAKLRTAGWMVGDWQAGQQTPSHIYRIDTDKWPDLAFKYEAGSLPLFVKMEGAPPVEVDRHAGYLNLQEIQDMFIGNKRRTKPKTR